MEGSVKTLQQRFQQVYAAVSELKLAQKSLTDLKEVETGSNLLVPIGGGAFVDAKQGVIDQVVLGIGAGISVEMPYSLAVQNLTERLSEMEKTLASVEQQLNQILTQLESHQDVAKRLSSEIQNLS